MNTVSLQEICDIVIGRTPARAEPSYWGAGHPWLSIADMGKEKYLSATKETITDVAVTECNCKLIPTGTVLLSFKLSIGKIGIAGVPIFTNEAIAALQIRNKRRVLSDYLYHALKSMNLSMGSNRAVMGATLNKHSLESIRVPLPPLNEQRRIAAILDKAAAIRRKQHEAKTSLIKLVYSLFYRIFGSPDKNEKGFELIGLGDACEKLTDGEHLNPVFVNSGVPMIMAANVRETGVSYDAVKYIAESDYEKFSQKCCPRQGDVLLVSRGATIGRSCVVSGERKFSLMGSVILLKTKVDVLSPIYLDWLLKNDALQKQLVRVSGSSAQQAIYLSHLKELRIPLPPIEIQNEFESAVLKIVELTIAKERCLQNAEHLFSSLQGMYVKCGQINA